MLYCPKCHATYSEGTQRFCTNEGARLLPGRESESGAQPAKGVFTSILSKSAKQKREASKSRSIISSEDTISFELPKQSELFSPKEVKGNLAEPEVDSDILDVGGDSEFLDSDKTFEPLEISRIIDPSTIPEAESDSSRSVSARTLQVVNLKPLSFSRTGDLSELEDSSPSSSDLYSLSDSDDLFELDQDEFPVLASAYQYDTSVESPGDILALDEFDVDESEAKHHHPNNIVLDLESDREVDLNSSIPDIELDLADLKQVDIPVQHSAIPCFEPIKAEHATKVPEDVFANNVLNVDAGAREYGAIKAAEDNAWKRRSSEAAGYGRVSWFFYPVVGTVLLGIVLLGVFYFTDGEKPEGLDQSENVAQQTVQQNTAVSENANTDSPTSNENSSFSKQEFSDVPNVPKSALLDVPPQPRNVKQPPNTRLFKNEKRNAKGVLAEKFLGFSIYFPKDWVQAESDNKFLDIAKKAPDGLPIKQLLITRYDSLGTFAADRAIFGDLVKTSNNDLRNILANYQVIYDGESMFQDGRWRVWEVKFQGIGGDKKLVIWGRRLWIPVQRPGMTSGFIVTMIGTSLAKDVKGVDDLGVTDDLAAILKTFEPDLK